jgi:hypothetical protein
MSKSFQYVWTLLWNWKVSYCYSQKIKLSKICEESSLCILPTSDWILIVLTKKCGTLGIRMWLIIQLAISGSTLFSDKICIISDKICVIFGRNCLFILAKSDWRSKRSLWRIVWVYGKMVNYALVWSVELNFFANNDFNLPKCITEGMIRMF